MSNRLIVHVGILMALASVGGVLIVLSGAPPSTLNQNGSLELWRWLYVSTLGVAVGSGLLVFAAQRGGWLADLSQAELVDDESMARAAGKASAVAVPRSAATTARRFVVGKPVPHERVRAFRATRESPRN